PVPLLIVGSSPFVCWFGPAPGPSAGRKVSRAPPPGQLILLTITHGSQLARAARPGSDTEVSPQPPGLHNLNVGGGVQNSPVSCILSSSRAGGGRSGFITI